MPWYRFGELFTVVQRPMAGLLSMNQVRQRIDRFLVDEDVDFSDVGRSVIDGFIIEGPITPRDHFKFAVEIEKNFTQRHFAGDFNSTCGQVVHALAF